MVAFSCKRIGYAVSLATGALVLTLVGCMPAQVPTGGDPEPVAPEMEDASLAILPPLGRAPAAPLSAVSLTEDRRIPLDDFRGQVVLLDFWATWSAPSLHEQVQLVKLYEELKERGFVVLGLCLDEGEWAEVSERVARFGLPYPVLRAEEDIVHAYGGVRAVPTKILLDREGRPRNTYAGSESIDQIRVDIKALL